MKEQMKKIWDRVRQDIYNFRHVVLILIIYYIVVRTITGKFCPSVIITGLPCPGCGMTRATIFLLTGQFARAARINPAIFLWAAFAVYAVVQRYIRGRKVKGATWLLTVIALLMIGLYIYRMVTVFPNRPPMSITRGSLLSNLIPLYEEFLNNIQRYGMINGVKNFFR